MMTYQETLQYLYTNLPMFSRSGAIAYKKDITNTVLLCEAIGNPQNKIKTIHVAGTNGKGSVSHMLAAVFQQSGYKTGLYTSPHLKDFRERIKIDGIMIPEDFIVSFVERIKEISEKIKPSFFELTVAMMLAWFAEQQVDIAIVETGLGGRLDSTNIVKPELSVITNIGYDHMNILGNTLQEIAFEKAGIIKEKIPVIIGETLPETKPVFLSAATGCNAEITFAEEEYAVTNFELHIDKLNVEVKNTNTQQIQNYTLDLNGIYQKNNLRTVITAIDVLVKSGYSFNAEKMHLALGKVKDLNGLHGRWDVIRHHPVTVLDVAHNEDG
ncbi:MAG: Mur ligase family protein, partial [Ginsengibacter sp.]